VRRRGIVTRRAAGLGAVVAIALLAGCGGSGASVKPPGYVQAELETSPISLDPRLATDAISTRVSELIFESLMELDARGNYIGGLAENFQRLSPTEIRFNLRRGIRFSDGRPLTAADVKYTYESVMDAAVASPKRAALEPLASVAAPDDYTIVMTTRRPYAAAMELATIGVVPRGSPVRGAALPPGSGRFRLDSFTRDESLILARNGARPAADAIAGVVFKIVPDPTVRALELAKGVADFAENNIQPDLLRYLRARPELSVRQFPGTAYDYIAFNFRDPRLRDVRVRRAIALAIDRDAIVRAMLLGTARVASGMIAPENWAFESDVTRYHYDPEAARRLLDQAGYPEPAGNSRRMRFTLVYKTTPEGRRLAEAFQAMLKRVGIGIDIRSNEWATFYSDVQRGNFDLTSMRWVGIIDPHHYYQVFDSRMVPPHGLNRGAYANPAMDRLLEAAEVAFEPARRREIYAEVQRLAADDLPYVSLWWQDNVVVMSKRIAGFAPYPNGSLISFSDLVFDSGAAR
jgi:peptide/nickel transport system substrate-binding protein